MRSNISIGTVRKEIHRQMTFRRIRVDDDRDDVRDAEGRDDHLNDQRLQIPTVTPASWKGLAKNWSKEDKKSVW